MFFQINSLIWNNLINWLFMFMLQLKLIYYVHLWIAEWIFAFILGFLSYWLVNCLMDNSTDSCAEGGWDRFLWKMIPLSLLQSSLMHFQLLYRKSKGQRIGQEGGYSVTRLFSQLFFIDCQPAATSELNVKSSPNLRLKSSKHDAKTKTQPADMLWYISQDMFVFWLWTE